MTSPTRLLACVLLLLWTVCSMTAADMQPRRHFSTQQRQKTVQRARAQRTHRSLYVDDKRQLVVLVSFSDLTFKYEEAAVLWDRIFNEKGFHDEPFRGSVYDYFYDQSYGLFRLAFDLHPITIDKEHAVYRSTSDDDENAAQLMLDLVEVLKTEVDDWTPYDWDDDGEIEQIVVLFAGKGQNNGGGSNAIWAHQADLKYYGNEPAEVTSDGKTFIINRYGMFPELSGSNDYGTFGTICHEYGHCLGLPDFYYGSSTSVVGTWDIMDYGNYNADGFCPPGYSAHERMVLGWLTPTELTEAATISNIAPLSEEPQAYLIRNDGDANEFYMIENRQQQGWDASLPGSGILIFHINYDEEVWHTGVPNDASLKRYTLFHANNSSARSGWAYPYEDNDSLTNLSRPAATLLHENADGTKLMSKPVTKMAVDANGLASFVFMGGNLSGIATTLTDKEEIIGIYDLQGRCLPLASGSLPPASGPYIIKYANGATRLSTGNRARCR